MIKKILALVLSLTLTVCAFASCSNKSDSSSAADASSSNTSSSDTSSADSESSSEDIATVEQPGTEEAAVPEPSLTIDGKKIDTDNFVVCTIDDTDIDFDTFRFYYYYTLDKYTSTYGTTLDDIADSENGFEVFMDDVITSIKQELAAPKLAKENGIELDEEDKKSVASQLDKAKSSYDSEEAYQKDLKSAYLTDELYQKMLESAQLYSKVTSTLFSNDGKYATKREDFKKIVQDTEEYCREIHVMVPYYSQAELDESSAEGYDDMSLTQKANAKSSAYASLDDDGKKKAQEAAKKVAEEVLEKAKAGEDFEKLIEEYGWDTGLEDPTDGYYFNKDTQGGYPDELVSASFKLKENEVSQELVENTTYGYFIIKRLPVDMEFVEANIDAMISSYDEPNTTEIFRDTMNSMTVTYCPEWDKLTTDSIQ